VEIAPGVHQLRPDPVSSNVFLIVEDDGLTLIDTGLPGAHWRILRSVARLGRRANQIKTILLTHYDIDHAGSLATLKAETGALIGVHAADVPLVEGQIERRLNLTTWQGRTVDAFLRWSSRSIYRPAQVDVRLADGDRLAGFRVVHTPGHTPGSACFFDAARRLLITGDALVNDRGLSLAIRHYAYDSALARASVQKLVRLDFEVCGFGHGRPLTHGAAERVREFLRDGKE